MTRVSWLFLALVGSTHAAEGRAPCVTEDAIRARLMATGLDKLFAPPAEDMRKELLDRLQGKGVMIAASIEGRFPEPGCFATVWIGQSSVKVHLLLSTTNHELRAMGPLARSPQSVAGAIYQDSTTFEPLETIDLDGDGVDEVLERTELDVHGYDLRQLTIYDVTGSEIREALRLTTHDDNEDGHMHNDEVTRFDAKVTLGAALDGKRPIVVDGKVHYGRHVRDRHLDPSEIVGHAVFRLEGGRFRREGARDFSKSVGNH